MDTKFDVSICEHHTVHCGALNLHTLVTARRILAGSFCTTHGEEEEEDDEDGNREDEVGR